MAMDSEEFKKLLETIKNNTAPAVLDLNDKLDETQTLTLIDALKTNVSVRSLTLERSWNSKNKLGPKVAMALASLLTVNRNLQSLDLCYNNIGAEGAKALASVLRGSHLRSLNLKHNEIGAEGAKALAPAIKESCLQSLNLACNKIGAEGAKALAPAIKSGRLRSLDLDRNQIGADGAAALAPSLKESRLQSLDLSDNQIGDDGIKTLAPALKESRLQSLILSSNQIKDDGVVALSPAIKESRLHSIDLRGNRIGTEGGRVLVLAVEESRLYRLDLGNRESGVENEGLIEKLLEPRRIQRSKEILEIQQNLNALESKFKHLLKNLNALESKFKRLLSLFSSEVSPSYANQCKALYIQAKRLLQTWEQLTPWDYNLCTATQHWQLLCWKCLDKLSLAEQHEIAALPFTWIEEEDPSFADSELKEIKESSETQPVVNISQPLSSAAAAQLQGNLIVTEQQLSQQLEAKVQKLLEKIAALETQLQRKDAQTNNTELEQQVLELRNQQTQLLERQLDPGLLMNQFDMMSSQIKGQVQDLDKLKSQLQKKFVLLGQETIEARQQAQAQHQQAAEDLTKALLAQERALNARIETLKAAVASGDAAKETQVLQLQQEHKLLMEEHQAKQQLLAKSQYIESHENLRLFYRSVQVKIQELFLAYKVLDSGLVQRAQSKTKDKVADGIQIAGDWIPLPYASEIASVFSKLIQHRSDKEEERRAETVAYLAIGFSEIDKIAEETARGLTERYEEQLHCLKPEGAKLLGECAVKYMLAYMTGKLLKPEQPLAEQFLYSVLTIDVHNGWWPKTHKDISTQASTAGWTDNGIFKHPGLKTQEGNFFSSEVDQKTKAHKYGYRLGSKEEALKAGLTQTIERVSVPASQRTSKLSPAGHKQIAHVTAIAENHGEQLQRIEKTFQLRLDREIKEKEELKKEIEMLKQFVGFNASQSPKNPQLTQGELNQAIIESNAAAESALNLPTQVQIQQNAKKLGIPSRHPPSEVVADQGDALARLEYLHPKSSDKSEEKRNKPKT